MNIIKQNPYRVLGLLANSSERELQKQIAVIKRYSEVGKSKSFDHDFDFLGDVSRNEEDVQISASKIEQAHKKIQYALFWFVNAGSFDEIAINNLKEGNKDKAIDIWSKTLRSDVSSKNYSSYHNLSTLYIASAIVDGHLDLNMMRMGVELKGALLKSDCFSSFVDLIGGEGSVVDREKISEIFVDEIIDIVDPLLGSNKHFKNKRIVDLFNEHSEHTKKYVVGRYTEDVFRSIEADIEKSKERREKHPADSDSFWVILYKTAEMDIKYLRGLLGVNDLQVQMVVDKTANELMQCSIDYFNEWRDSETKDPGEEALKIAKHAKSLGPAGRAKNWIDENYEVVKEWVDDKPERELQDKVSSKVELVTSLIEGFDEAEASRAIIEKFIADAKPRLIEIRDVVGSQNELYLQVSSVVVERALGELIDIFNHQQEQAVKHIVSLDFLKSTINWIGSAIEELQSYDTTAKTGSRLVQNRRTMLDIRAELNAVATTTAAKQSSGGCYIATMAYGNYDHPQVLHLRRYRDQVLAKSCFGRLFITFYYLVSPYFVRALAGRKNINSFIRRLLDKWIEVIKA
jgi:hypothetical protein